MESHGGGIQADYWTGSGIDPVINLTRVLDYQSDAMHRCLMIFRWKAWEVVPLRRDRCLDAMAWTFSVESDMFIQR